MSHSPQNISLARSPWWCRRRYFGDRKSTRLNSSHSQISYAVFCLKKKKIQREAKANDRLKNNYEPGHDNLRARGRGKGYYAHYFRNCDLRASSTLGLKYMGNTH